MPRVRIEGVPVVRVGESEAFRAFVGPLVAVPVAATWTADDGSISPDGVYTAPATAPGSGLVTHVHAAVGGATMGHKGLCVMPRFVFVRQIPEDLEANPDRRSWGLGRVARGQSWAFEAI